MSEIKTAKSESTFFEDMSALQVELKNPKKTESGYDNRYTYAPLDKILEDYKPICLKHNFLLLSTISGGVQNVELRHISGESLKGDISIPDFSGDAQKLGSYLTYARRYLIMNILNVMGEDEDDDGLKTTKMQASAKKPTNTEKPIEIEYRGVKYRFVSRIGKDGKPYKAFVNPQGVFLFESTSMYKQIAAFARGQKESVEQNTEETIEDQEQVDIESLPEDLGAEK